MEARFGGEASQFCAMESSDFRAVGKRTSEWDLKDWKWDGDLLLASKINSVPQDCRSRQLFPHGLRVPEYGNSPHSYSSCSDEVIMGTEKGRREMEKRRRDVMLEDDSLNDEVGGLSLKLGGNGYPVAQREVGTWEGTSGKKTKLNGLTSNRAVCQVENCGANLSNAKDYHRRHKVCEMHSKSCEALVGNVMQRFCQQCSRFHVLQEFDEGKRSCRRRLAGHNRRRRKTQPETVANGINVNDDHASGYLLLSLLKILSNVHSSSRDQTNDQDLLSHLLRSLSGHGGAPGERNMEGFLKKPHNLPNDRISLGNSEMVSTLLPNGSQRPVNHLTVTPPSMPLNGSHAVDTITEPSAPCPIKESILSDSVTRDTTAGRTKLNTFDLNDTYVDSDDGIEDLDTSPIPSNMRIGALESPSWQQDSHHSSPPSGNSDSASAHSPSSSTGDTQGRTDRIVFKLFGKEPNDLPIVLRAQILDWLSHSPSDIESYIRPGCVVLTIYLRLPESTWEELCCNLTSSLGRLMDAQENTFWRTEWVLIRLQHQIAFLYNGHIVVDRPLPLKSYDSSRVVSVRPIAVSMSETTQFLVKGFNLSRPATRLFCALEGKYLIQETARELSEGAGSLKESDQLQCINFTCSIPSVIGRGFFEVEDLGFGSNFFPFLVAEKDVSAEICMLESEIGLVEADQFIRGSATTEAKNKAMDFIHEMGWLLHRSRLRSRLGRSDPSTDKFSFKRYKWLMEFSMDHDWCAVVRKLLDILLNGTVGLGKHSSLEDALSGMCLLHRAVRRDSRPLVEHLLSYVPEQVSDELTQKCRAHHLFRPDAVGPASLTPLHIAAGRDGSEDVLDALINDPGMVGIEAWKNAHDSTGFTPEDYARLRGHYSYIHQVQKKINRRSVSGQVVVDIPGAPPPVQSSEKQRGEANLSFHTERARPRSDCKHCAKKLVYGNVRRSLPYRPAMLSMVGIAAVCVCVALLFKSSPEVLYMFRPFSWEMLGYGPR